MFEDHRPAYHFTAPSGWMNDPNGLLWYEGYYHLFYQHNPTGDYWGNIHWGHAQSRDLIRWEHLPIGLYPSSEFGESHCYSGCAVMDGEIPTIVYTSVGEGNRNARTGAEQRMAQSHDKMRTWQKLAAPMMVNTIHPKAILEWRDPFIWKEKNEWNLVLGGSLDGYGCVTLYRSPDLRNWKLINTLYLSADYSYLECPNLLRFGERSVLFYSPGNEVVYHSGTINEEGRFIVEHTGFMDMSGRQGFYAPNTYLNDPKGRYICFGWMTENARGGRKISGYQGALSLPRILTLDSGGKLRQKAAEEIETYLTGSIEECEYSLNNEEKPLKTKGRELEIRLSVSCHEKDDFSLDVYCSADRRERTRIHYKAGTRNLTLEKGLSSLNPVPKDFFRVNLDFVDYGADNTGTFDLRVFLDHSIIEIFANDQAVISGRVYPCLDDSDGMILSGTVRKVAVKIRQIHTAAFK